MWPSDDDDDDDDDEDACQNHKANPTTHHHFPHTYTHAHTSRLADRYEQLAPGTVVDISGTIKSLALDAVARAAFSLPLGALDDDGDAEEEGAGRSVCVWNIDWVWDREIHFQSAPLTPTHTPHTGERTASTGGGSTGWRTRPSSWAGPP